MRRLMLFALLIMIPALTGCSGSRQVENQAYVIVLGIDRTDDGGIELSTQIPKVAGGQESSGGASASSGSYVPVSVQAPDYEQAVERLDWSVPREMNLTQLELIVLSEDIAKSEGFAELLGRIFNTEHLYNAASVVVCDGSAKEFVDALRPNLGTRLSADLEASIEHYQDIGVLPEYSLANLYYRSHSVYSDPLAGFAHYERKPADAVQPASALQGTLKELSGAAESAIETRYLGAVVFSDGVCRGSFSGDEAILINLINNSLDRFRYICGGESLEFTPLQQTRIRIDTQAEPVRIELGLRLSVAGQERTPEEAVLRETLERDLKAVIQKAQAMQVDPFGFAEAAAKHFLTLEDWMAYDWKSRFSGAETEVKLQFSPADT